MTSTSTATIAHEVIPLFPGGAERSRWAPVRHAATVVNSWVVEGQAEWVGETIAVELAGSSSHIGEGWWAPYLYAPKTPLITRSYDAIGFYARLGERGQDPWLVLDSMITAANGLEAFDLATDKIAMSFAGLMGDRVLPRAR